MIPVNDITSSYDDVIIKNCGVFYSQILLKFENKWNTCKISSKKEVHLKFSQNVIYQMVNTLQKKKIIFFRILIFSIVFYCSQTT